jgi:hypothetical protein
MKEMSFTPNGLAENVPASAEKLPWAPFKMLTVPVVKLLPIAVKVPDSRVAAPFAVVLGWAVSMLADAVEDSTSKPSKAATQHSNFGPFLIGLVPGFATDGAICLSGQIDNSRVAGSVQFAKLIYQTSSRGFLGFSQNY